MSRILSGKVLEEIYQSVSGLFGKGKVATYIPALASVSPEKFGFHLCTVDGERFHIGDYEERFSIQSISKVFTLSMAMRLVDEELWKRVGREPSGNRFNSLIQLEYEKGIPRNPFINAGALLICDVLVSELENPKQALLAFMRELSGSEDIDFDEDIAKSELDTGHINFAMANFLKGFGNLHNSVETVLDLYFHQCSIMMNCKELSEATLHLACRGDSKLQSDAGLTMSQIKRLVSLMVTCGMYDAVGDFAYRVGLPAKSGVGGGIIAMLPGEYAVAVWSPELDTSGNSLVGCAALEHLTTATGRSIF